MLKAAINESFLYLKYLKIKPKSFKLTIESNLKSSEGFKYGFGSSAAIITGTIKSILLFHDVAFDNLLVFKLAVLSKARVKSYSSGGDLAASLHNGLIYYRRYNLKWLEKNINSNKVYSKKWPHLKIVYLDNNFNFGAIWTKKSYKTVPLNYKITKAEYKLAQKIVRNAYRSIINNSYYQLKDNINLYEKWLEKVLNADALVTDEIKLAINVAKNHHLTAKISGAGGGDSLIVLYPKGYNLFEFEKSLEKNNLEYLKI